METIEENVISTVASNLRVPSNSITLQSPLTDLGADELDLVRIIVDLEDRYAISLTDEDVEKVETVGDIARLIQEACAPKDK